VLARRVFAILLCGLVPALIWRAGDAASSKFGEANPTLAPRLASFAGAVACLAAQFSAPAPAPAIAEKKSGGTIAFVGDIALSLGVAARIKSGEDEGFPFGAVKDRLRHYDLLVGNLECVVASQGRPVIPEPMIAPLGAPRLLLDAGFDLVSVANNHTLDLSSEGYFEMLGRLESAGLPHFGTTLADAFREPFLVRDVSGVRVAFVGHVDRGKERSLADVARARSKADVVLVFVHWGNEYALMPNRYQRTTSRELIDAGASAVIAAHAHVVQPAEVYQGQLIAHGLGNFVFSGMTRQGARTGALLELDISARGVDSYRFRRVDIDERGAPSLASEASEDAPLDPPGPRPLPPI